MLCWGLQPLRATPGSSCLGSHLGRSHLGERHTGGLSERGDITTQSHDQGHILLEQTQKLLEPKQHQPPDSGLKSRSKQRTAHGGSSAVLPHFTLPAPVRPQREGDGRGRWQTPCPPTHSTAPSPELSGAPSGQRAMSRVTIPPEQNPWSWRRPCSCSA